MHTKCNYYYATVQFCLSIISIDFNFLFFLYFLIKFHFSVYLSKQSILKLQVIEVTSFAKKSQRHIYSSFTFCKKTTSTGSFLGNLSFSPYLLIDFTENTNLKWVSNGKLMKNILAMFIIINSYNSITNYIQYYIKTICLS